MLINPKKQGVLEERLQQLENEFSFQHIGITDMSYVSLFLDVHDKVSQHLQELCKWGLFTTQRDTFDHYNVSSER